MAHVLFRALGTDIAENQQRCAGTWEVLEQVPGLYSAMFSVLEPRQRSTAHRPYQGHLPRTWA
ncbi:MAG: aspartyl/asparaginyl beta-hydroxylase domain-containing protein [Acidimicrobiales bacterium]